MKVRFPNCRLSGAQRLRVTLLALYGGANEPAVGRLMNAVERLGWSLDDLHERIATCDTFLDTVEEDWIAAAPIAFLQLADELLSLGKEFRQPVPVAMLRRLRRPDEKLTAREATNAGKRIRSWLMRQESDLPEPSDDVISEPDNLVALPKGAYTPEKERLQGLRAVRWVAIPARAEVRKRVTAVRAALNGLALLLSAANADDDMPFGTLDRKRLAMVAGAARHTLGGPLVELGLLRSLTENAAIVERQGRTSAARETGKRARRALEELASDLG